VREDEQVMTTSTAFPAGSVIEVRDEERTVSSCECATADLPHPENAFLQRLNALGDIRRWTWPDDYGV
jgi:hypothetical protein